MTFLVLLREVLGCYLILTLAATALAKALEWRNTSRMIAVESIIPRNVAPIATAILCVVEISLAALLASRQIPRAAGLMTAGLFVAFTAYKMAVVVKTGNVSCSCTGTSRVFKATRPGILASLLATLVQAGCGCVWAMLPAGGAPELPVISAVAFLIPVVMSARKIATVNPAGHSKQLKPFGIT